MPKNHPGFHRRRETRLLNDERVRADRDYRRVLLLSLRDAALSVGLTVDLGSVTPAVAHATERVGSTH